MKTFEGLNAQQWYAKGLGEVLARQYQAAARAYIIAFELEEGISPAMFYKCAKELLARDKDAAKKCFDKLILNEKLFVREDARFIYELTDHYEKLGDYQSALRCYVIAVDLDPSRGAVWYYMAIVLFEKFQEYERAFKSAHQALLCYEDSPDDYQDALLLKDKIFKKLYAKAFSLYVNEEYQKALPLVESLLSTSEDPCCMMGQRRLGTHSNACEKHLGALTLKNSIKKSLQKKADYWCGMGEEFMEEKEPEAALACAKQALAIYPNYVNAEVLEADAENALERQGVKVVDSLPYDGHSSDEEEKPMPQTSYEKYHQLGVKLPPSEPLSTPPAVSGAQPSTNVAPPSSASSTPFQSPLVEVREIKTPAGFHDAERELDHLMKVNPQQRSVV